MSVAERLQRVLDAATLRHTPKRPAEQRVTSPFSNLPDRAAKLACYTALYGSHGSSSVLSLAVPSGQAHAASVALLSQDLAPTSSARLRLHEREQAAALLFASLPVLAVARGTGFSNAAAAMSEPPEELVAVKIGWVPRWQQNHLDAVRRAWVQLLTWLREHHRKQFDSFDGSIEAYYTRRFLDSIFNANAPMAVNTETSAQPFLRDGQFVAPSIKIALTAGAPRRQPRHAVVGGHPARTPTPFPPGHSHTPEGMLHSRENCSFSVASASTNRLHLCLPHDLGRQSLHASSGIPLGVCLCAACKRFQS